MTTPSTTSTTAGASSAPDDLLDPGKSTFAARVRDYYQSPHPILLFLYYTAIIVSLLIIYSRGNFATPTFIYQGF